MFELQEVSKRFGDTRALGPLTLEVATGRTTVLIGPSGCGKSTLPHLLGGLDRPTSGEVYLRGKRIDDLNEAQRAILRRNEIGFVFQFFNLVGNFTVADNVDMPALLSGMSRTEARERRTKLLEELGIADKATARPCCHSPSSRRPPPNATASASSSRTQTLARAGSTSAAATASRRGGRRSRRTGTTPVPIGCC